MLEVTNIKVRSFDLDFLEVSWETGTFAEDILDFQFQVLRSEGPAGPFLPITDKFKDLYSFRDLEANQLSSHREWYYKIRVTEVTSSDIQDYPLTINGVALEAAPDLEALEIANRMKLVLSEYTGRKVWIFPIKTFGQRCTCFDQDTGRRTRSQCLTCFDVGVVGGFHTPVETYMQVDPSRESTRLAETGELHTTNTTARLASFPRLKPRDIVVEAENKRWRVHSVSSTEKLRAVVHQEVTLHLIPRSDIEYRLPVAVDLDTLQPSPARQYTNPQKL